MNVYRKHVNDFSEVIVIDKSSREPCGCTNTTVYIYSSGFWLPTVEVCSRCKATWVQKALTDEDAA